MLSALLSPPPDSEIVAGRIKICENCSRDFFACLDSINLPKRKLCCRCADTLLRPSNQLWECLRCGMFRAWGLGTPFDTCCADLRCQKCSDVTRHSFWKVA